MWADGSAYRRQRKPAPYPVPPLLAPASLWVRQTPDGWPSPPVLTYFQPRVVLQLSQKISATECSPVSRRRCSAGPHPTLTLGDGRTQHAGGRGGVSLRQRTPKTAQKAQPLERAQLTQLRALPPAPHPLLSSAWHPSSPGLPTKEQQTGLPPKERQTQRAQGTLLGRLSPSLQRGKLFTHTRTHAQGRGVDSHGVKQVGSAMAPLEGLRRHRAGGDCGEPLTPGVTRSLNPPRGHGGGRPGFVVSSPGDVWRNLMRGAWVGVGVMEGRYLGDELVVFGQVCAAVDAAVGAVAARQVAAEGLGGEAGGGRARVAAGHDGLEDDALAGGGRRRRAAPAQTVAGEAAEQVG